MLAGQIQQNPVKARGIMSYILQGATDLAASTATKSGAVGGSTEIPFAGGAEPTLKQPMPQFRAAQQPAERPTYGGPQ
jgi:hypothetical protein